MSPSGPDQPLGGAVRLAHLVPLASHSQMHYADQCVEMPPIQDEHAGICRLWLVVLGSCRERLTALPRTRACSAPLEILHMILPLVIAPSPPEHFLLPNDCSLLPGLSLVHAPGERNSRAPRWRKDWSGTTDKAAARPPSQALTPNRPLSSRPVLDISPVPRQLQCHEGQS